MTRILALFLFGFAALALSQTEPTGQAALPGDPFSLRRAWAIGGEGSWDYLALDPTASQLFIAHGPVVQVVDLETGTVLSQIPVQDALEKDATAGQRRGLNEAHGIALDDSGQFGYVSVGKNGNLQVFDRRLYKVVASVPTGPNPRAIVFEPLTRLVFVICAAPPEAAPPVASPSQPSRPTQKSEITIVETEKWTRIGDILVTGKLGFAQADGAGQVFVNVVDRNEILSFDAQGIVTWLHNQPKKDQPAEGGSHPALNWAGLTNSSQPPDGHPVYFSLGMGCQRPVGVADDSAHQRLFVACENAKMAVLNSSTGAQVALLDTGPGTDAIAYDANHGLIFAANGGGLGSLTIIRQHVTDTYEVVQVLPTIQRARTLAVNPVTGDVYLVSDLLGFDLTKKGEVKKPGGLPVVQATSAKGSFQVLVVGH